MAEMFYGKEHEIIPKIERASKSADTLKKRIDSLDIPKVDKAVLTTLCLNIISDLEKLIYIDIKYAKEKEGNDVKTVER